MLLKMWYLEFQYPLKMLFGNQPLEQASWLNTRQVLKILLTRHFVITVGTIWQLLSQIQIEHSMEFNSTKLVTTAARFLN